jgi:hypothetical protein
MGACVFVDPVLANNSFEEVHCEEIWVISPGCYEGSCNGGVRELVISLKHERGCEKWLLLVVDLPMHLLLHFPKAFLSNLVES